MNQDPTLADFQTHQGSAFRATGDDGQRVELRLTEVAPLSRAAGSGSHPLHREPFSLVFTSAPEVRLPQRIYALEHEHLGQLDIFLVPIGIGQYEAIFN